MRSCRHSLAALAQLLGPLSRGQGAKPSHLYVAYCLLGWRGCGGTSSEHTQGAPPPKKGEGWSVVTQSSPAPYPPRSAPPQLPIWPSPWLPPPLPYMVWGPLG